ncbi:uncharacterized protein LOC135714627 [Ochlerotatus camptorhynchus]|uniref:uncharacterized protein LOC135714627 n=1 Tax=Ochlerotatus camptorhynchus TaxID=644619 RepID=UPI0031DE0707
MPPKRKQISQPIAKRGKNFVLECRGQNVRNLDKMAAHKLNVADLRALLQQALEQQGESLDSTGYAYVTVDEGSNYAAFESQDPLASIQVTSNVEMHKEIKNESSAAREKDSMFLHEKKYKQLSEQHKKLKQKYSKLEQDKLSSDDYALRMGKELQQLKDKQKMPQAKFTEEEGILITVAKLAELNERAESDSMFVGLLSTRLIGTERLETVSVMGQASHRFAKLKKPDGTPQYPATEKIGSGILEFICS